MKKKKLTLEQHQNIGSWLNAAMKDRFVCDILNAYGEKSRPGRYSLKLRNAVINLKSDMENMAHNDGHGESATDIYYPRKQNKP